MHRPKPRFWKPGEDDTPTTKDDFIRQETTESSSIIYNPFRTLSLDEQRQKLPIYRTRLHLLYLAEQYRVVILLGDTGSGKSTQVPQYLLEVGYTSKNAIIGVTEPRRVAATMLAQRVSDERGCLLGDEVGYAVRFEDHWTPKKTKIKFMTEGLLIREMMSDPLLMSYQVIMVDEAHERSINTDILLGLLKKVIQRRSDLKLIIASATLDAVLLRDFFNAGTTKSGQDPAVIMSTTGGGHRRPVKEFYVDQPVANYVQSSVETTIKIHEKCPSGDVLVFLTGQEEVETAVDMLIEYARGKSKSRDSHPHNLKMLVFPLYGSLPASRQVKVVSYTSRHIRKVVVATNIAETSLTIPGIVYVVDCGFVKIKCYNPTTWTDSLVVTQISQASAKQRAGRAGRTGPGHVYRLYTESDFEKLQVNSIPEMQRCNLTFPILQLKALGVKNILRFDFPSAPPAKNVVNALDILYALEAIDDHGELTKPLGVQMSEFPLDPMFAKMLLASEKFGCSTEALTICAMLQVNNVFVSPYGKSREMKLARQKFAVQEGDHITLLNVYNAFLKNGKDKRWCGNNFLNYQVLCRAVEVRKRLAKLLKHFEIPLVSADGEVDAVCRCIVSGFFPNAAYLHHSGTYRTIKGDFPIHIHQSSVLYTEEAPKWVVYSEVTHTTKDYMQEVLAVEHEWLCELAPHYYRFGTLREVAEMEREPSRGAVESQASV